MDKSPKEYAEYLIKFFLPRMYCYMGSGMLSDTYDKKIALDFAKECALFNIEQMHNFGSVNNLREELMYLNSVETEIKKMK